MAKPNMTGLDPVGLLRIYRTFGRHYRKYWKVLLAAYLSLFAAIGTAALVPWPLKLILDHVILQRPMPEAVGFLDSLFSGRARALLLVLAIAIVVLALLQALFSYMNKFWIASTAARMTADIRERVFAHLQRLSLTFHESSRSGKLVYLLTHDVNQMRDFLVVFPRDFCRRVGLIATYGVVMFAVDWRLSLIALSTAPLFLLASTYFSAGMTKAMRTRREREGQIAAIIDENASSMALVQAYRREDTERDRFQEWNRRSLKARLRGLRLQTTFTRMGSVFVTLSTAGVLYFGGRYALAGDISPGTLVLFVAYLQEIFHPVEKFGGTFIELATARASGERLREMIENDTIVEDDPDALPAPPFRGRTEFRNVSFAYHERGSRILDDVSFVVEPGETVALVGSSGAGKSTLISLLLRFYDPCEGQILIDGECIRTFTLKSLRDQVTILLQDARLFRQTVRENIAFGRVGATDEDVVDAARRAEAHEFITRMPEGYDTVMSERGDNLSGGQVQRINIARAIIRDTPIVILDEPITGLDAEAEAKVNAAIRELAKGRTTFIVSHRLSSIASVDRILVLEDGRLTQGTHESLQLESSHYRALFGSHGPAGREEAHAAPAAVSSRARARGGER